MPQTDFIKLITSHVVAALMSIGGILLLVFIWMQPAQFDPAGNVVNTGKEGVMALIAGFVGASTTFLYQTNTQGATRAQTRNDLLTNSTPSEETG